MAKILLAVALRARRASSSSGVSRVATHSYVIKTIC
jgi:hypothetical protein